MMNTQQIKELEQILRQQIDVNRIIVDKMNHKKGILITGTIDQLPAVDQELIALGQKVANLEQKRIELMVSAGHQDKPLQEVIESLDIQYARALLPLRTELNRVLGDVQALNRNNEQLLELSRQWISETFGLLKNLMTPEGASYDATGGKKAGTTESVMGEIQSTIIQNA